MPTGKLVSNEFTLSRDCPNEDFCAYFAYTQPE